ncbi:MAG: hypothetical protein K9K66_04400 [Desulfarculaceae bacterium]|nr:hypothetical protein [Desulfarculaceae bacterium]MCF8073284.1 hypothetical protein [Desulfarculaceae bacterium]MCF8100880.1 hypothetical protein [Desulfarculaceae bacterium]MCF8116664.1 hypothetical protein [Desulfarculaceae bacterium]
MAIWWKLVCFPYARVPVTAPTAHQLEDILWAELSKWGKKLEPHFRDQFDIKSKKVVNRANPDDWFAVGRTARRGESDALQGFHDDNLMFVVDEAFGVHEKNFEPVKGALTQAGNSILIMGNPTDLTGYAAKAFKKNRARWNCLTFNSEDSPLVSAEYVEEMEAEYGRNSDIFKVRVQGEFPRAAFNQLIAHNLADAARGKFMRPEMYQHAAKLLGVDVARFGDDRSVITKRQGLLTHPQQKFYGIDTMTLAGHVAHEITTWKPDATFVDVGGMGAGVVDRLRQLGHEVIEVNFGDVATDENKYHNKRSEIWGEMMAWLKAGGSIPDDDDLVDDLVGPLYAHDSKQRLALERKRDMKKRGLASPDCGDSLAVTFAEKVSPKSWRGDAQPKVDYDPLQGLPDSETSGMDYNPI